MVVAGRHKTAGTRVWVQIDIVELIMPCSDLSGVPRSFKSDARHLDLRLTTQTAEVITPAWASEYGHTVRTWSLPFPSAETSHRYCVLEFGTRQVSRSER